jgi:hypothetical protein
MTLTLGITNGIRDWVATHRHMKKERLKREEAARPIAERAGIAKQFNDLYTCRAQYVPDAPPLPIEFFSVRKPFAPGLPFVPSGNLWMCPNCNKVHAPFAFNPISGLLFPQCCATAAGHRINERIKSVDDLPEGASDGSMPGPPLPLVVFSVLGSLLPMFYVFWKHFL